MRIGYGYDSHTFEENRKLIIGGTDIAYHLGLKGHSDADVLIHAIIDAILGALALGDIGSHFPDNDEKYKNISSVELLKNVMKIIDEKNYEIKNIDSTIICEKPKLRDYIDSIRNNLKDILKIDLDCISVKAKTNEKMDAVGEGLGIIAHAVVLMENKK
jgi:2-C-methyl-D-erythritol 2,4-cyclodiphosphate synthase